MLRDARDGARHVTQDDPIARLQAQVDDLARRLEVAERVARLCERRLRELDAWRRVRVPPS